MNIDINTSEGNRLRNNLSNSKKNNTSNVPEINSTSIDKYLNTDLTDNNLKTDNMSDINTDQISDYVNRFNTERANKFLDKQQNASASLVSSTNNKYDPNKPAVINFWQIGVQHLESFFLHGKK